MKLNLCAGPGLVDFLFRSGCLYATVVNSRDRELAPRIPVVMGEDLRLGPFGLVTIVTEPHRLAIYAEEEGGSILLWTYIDPLEPREELVVSIA